VSMQGDRLRAVMLRQRQLREERRAKARRSRERCRERDLKVRREAETRARGGALRPEEEKPA
jgi:hypothetical protein